MNILFLIGNGFDLNIGLKSRYADFYKYYNEQESTLDIINNLKSNINNNIQNWSDLELALGEYTKELNSVEEFDQINDDIRNHLSEYLAQQENNFDLNNIDKDIFFKDLCFSEERLLNQDKQLIVSHKNQWKSETWYINIITFNYTRVLENLIENTLPLELSRNDDVYKILLSGIEHIHGFTNRRMVLGVNDHEQISNKEFRKNDDIVESFVKNECNIAGKHLTQEKCTKIIKEANLICVFGSSLGDTDKIWWEIIGRQLREGCLLILFVHMDEEISDRDVHRQNRTVKKIASDFLNKTTLSEEEKKSFRNKIIVAINTDMFGILKK